MGEIVTYLRPNPLFTTINYICNNGKFVKQWMFQSIFVYKGELCFLDGKLFSYDSKLLVVRNAEDG